MLMVLCLFLVPLVIVWIGGLHAQYKGQGNEEPLVVVCDWDKPPYEFRNDRGEPDGYYVDVLSAVLDRMGRKYRFVMRESSEVDELFRKDEFALTFDNGRKYKAPDYYTTSNILSYYRVSVATRVDTVDVVPLKLLDNSDRVAFYHDGYAAQFFEQEISTDRELHYVEARDALLGLINGQYDYYVWNEASLKWKINEYNFTDEVFLQDVSLPVGEIHIVGHDSLLVSEIDEAYSRLKQRGEIDRIYKEWFHPGQQEHGLWTTILYCVGVVAVLGVGVYVLSRWAKARVRKVTRRACEANRRMHNALDMGHFKVMLYDLHSGLVTNSLGHILPDAGMTIEEFSRRVCPEGRQSFEQKVSMLRTGREHKFEMSKLWNFGTDENPEWRLMRGHMFVEQDQNDQPRYIFLAVHDIEREKEDNGVHKQQLQEFMHVFNTAGVGIAFFDYDGWVISANPKMRELYQLTIPKDVKRQRRSVNMLNIPVMREMCKFGKRRDMSVCQIIESPEQKTFNYVELKVQGLRDAEGNVTQYFIMVTDLNVLQRLDKEIGAQTKLLNGIKEEVGIYEQRLRHMLVNSNIYMYEVDFLSKTVSFTQSPVKKDIVLSFEEYLSLVVEEEREEAAANLSVPDDIVASNRHFRHTIRHDIPQWIRYVGKKKYDCDGNVVGVVGIAIVETELVDAKRKLQETAELAEDSVRLKSVFLASMTHELRTPLNAIVGFATVLKVTDDPDERKELIDIIISSCDMLQRLIDDILIASSITKNLPATAIHASKVDFVHSFEGICAVLEYRIKQAGLEFIKDAPYENFYTTMDMARVQQIVTNFVTNAVKFTQQGHIRLGYRYEQHGLYIYCEDTGTGIPKDKQEIIFERFIKLDEFIQGTGMGLAICKELTERMNGKIGVDSEGLGKGSTFWIWLPCERRLTPDPDEVEGASPVHPQESDKKV